MRHEFAMPAPVPIAAGPPAITTAAIDVAGIDDGAIAHLSVGVDLDHAWYGDLVLSLLSPRGTRVVLARRRGGRAGLFRDTVFDAVAPVALADAIPPFQGRFRPHGDLRELRGCHAAGTWTLEVDDRAFHDAGLISRFAITLETTALQEPAFVIDVRIKGGLTSAQQAAFATAASRWSRIITADVPSVVVEGETVDDVVIDAEGVAIDGPRGILGQAGPTLLRPGSFIPAAGIMLFDTADLAAMERDGSLVSVVTHEMAHVLGFGTNWDELGLRQGAGTVNPTFTGPNAMREFAALSGGEATRAVPLANVGGPGTRDGHWRESVFGNELMTGFLNAGRNPLSRLTIAALEDTGYEVSYTTADAYALPSRLDLALLGIGAEIGDHGDHGVMLTPPKRVLPESALV